jgi:YD repeat-containing protein
VSVIVLLSLLGQPLAPALANAPQRQVERASAGVTIAGQASAQASSSAPTTTAARAASSSALPGIRVYTQWNVNCASPQFQPIEPFYTNEGYGSYANETKEWYICSTGATVHVELYGEAQGYGGNVVYSWLRCYSGACTAFPRIDPPVVKTIYPGINCNHVLKEFRGSVYLPPGKYQMRVTAGANAYFPPFCALHPYYRIRMSLSAPPLSAERCYAAEDPCEANYTQGQAGHPVNTRSGNFTHQEVDLSIPTRGLPLEFERSYNALDTTAGPLGRGWTHSYNMRLVASTYAVTLVAPRGSRLPFYRKFDGTFAPGPGVRSTLVRNPDGTYRLTRGDQVIRNFDADGRLVALDDGRGNVTTLGYTNGNLTTITTPDGRALTLAYDESGRITQLSDPLGRTVAYSYSGNTLTGVVDRAGQAHAYTYRCDGLSSGAGCSS